ncbi:hypothetical protein Pst134EA_017416 [Puccinia striiformis f. sp. tritici]|uniref:hypothetical protein n=1 Tax=Puccinia striiformis f. sp. tritici TaxID=168172 RepID=UPI002008C73B|nr:hypothetical protein Pst134EA_017416 [Puccinia striiformis f. sp. tritici]KAH9461106.1 hypothetical protein Pst134EA_017416 [Puccinia striiformis f. sp. tritici]
MTSTPAPNHPVNISGCFETLDVSVPDSVRANQYGNVSTPSCLPCAGLLGDKAEDIELTLITNTALNNLLQPNSIYFLAGRLLAPNEGIPPVLTYQQTSLVRLTAAGPTAPELANKATVVGLGLVVKRCGVVSCPGHQNQENQDFTVLKIHRFRIIKKSRIKASRSTHNN